MPRSILALPASLLTPLLAAPSFERIVFAMPERCDRAVTLDIDGDGDRDLVGLCRTKVVAVVLPEQETRTLVDLKDGALIHGALWDADGDGDQDIAVVRFSRAKDSDFSLAWLENPSWEVHPMDSEIGGTHGVARGDLDGDGRDDLVAANVEGAFPKSVAWFNGATGERAFLQANDAGGRPHYLATGDIDGDGQTDVLLGDGGGFRLYLNPGAGKRGQDWPVQIVDRQPGGTNVVLADLNGDGRLDVVGANGHGSGVYWYANPGWTRHQVEAEMQDVHALDAGDLDGDGDLDLAAGSFGGYKGKKAEKDALKIVRWYENDGTGRFTAHDLDTGNAQQSYALEIVDVDGDGRNDILLGGREANNLVWYRNH